MIFVRAIEIIYNFLLKALNLSVPIIVFSLTLKNFATVFI